MDTFEAVPPSFLSMRLIHHETHMLVGSESLTPPPGFPALLFDATGRAATVVSCDKTVCMALGKTEFLNMLQRGASVIESVYAHNNAYGPWIRNIN